MHHIKSPRPPESSFLGVHFNESLPLDQKSIPLLWEMGMGIAVMELEAFHLPESLTCKSGWRVIIQVSGTVGPTQHSHPSVVLTSMCTRSASLSSPDTDLGKKGRNRLSEAMGSPRSVSVESMPLEKESKSESLSLTRLPLCTF